MDLQDLEDDRRSDLRFGEITIAPEHQTQIINYLKATGIAVGLRINFGNPKLETKRFTRDK
jgi:PD-(D/E)XK nuclease superfamily